MSVSHGNDNYGSGNNINNAHIRFDGSRIRMSCQFNLKLATTLAFCVKQKISLHAQKLLQYNLQGLLA